jgi:two-component sensor histidine kinase
MEAESDAYVNLESYLPNLIDSLQQINTSPGQDITCTVHADEAHLPLDQAVSTVLMINELLTNAFKHAFREDQQGHIQISAESKNNQLQLQIADDGQGLPEDFSIESDSMGMQVVSTLLIQLNAKMTYESSSGEGTVFTIQMPLENEN